VALSGLKLSCNQFFIFSAIKNHFIDEVREMISRIYKIVNDVNDKIYVGKTTKSLDIRFKEHISDSTRKTEEKRPLYNAIRKYGAEHFNILLIEECDVSIENERE
jgi:group I intron endonuclease